MGNKKAETKRLFECGVAVPQLEKLRMTEFYQNFMNQNIVRQNIELIQMDSDSLCIDFAHELSALVIKKLLINTKEEEKYQFNKSV